MAKKVKKTTLKKETKKRPQRKKVKKAEHLTARDVENFRQILLEKRKVIVGDVNMIENESLKKSRIDAAGDLSSMPIHMADVGTDNYEQEFALGLVDSERKLLEEINDALERIDEGTYGICEGTKKTIAKVRLEACPWTRYCIEYARMVEKGLSTEDQIASEEFEEE